MHMTMQGDQGLAFLDEPADGNTAHVHVQRGMIDVLAGIHGVRASADELAFLQVPYPGETPLRRYVAWKKSLYEWGRSGMRFPLIERLID